MSLIDSIPPLAEPLAFHVAIKVDVNTAERGSLCVGLVAQGLYNLENQVMARGRKGGSTEIEERWVLAVKRRLGETAKKISEFVHIET